MKSIGPFLLRWALKFVSGAKWESGKKEGGREGVRCFFFFFLLISVCAVLTIWRSGTGYNITFQNQSWPWPRGQGGGGLGGGGLSWTERVLILNQGNRTSYYYRGPFSKLIFHIISYHCMYSLFIFHPLFDIICYCLSMRLVFMHVQKKTGSLLLNLLKTSTLSVVQTTLSVVYIIYSVSCKHLICRLYTPQGQLCTLFINLSVVNVCSVGQLCTLVNR